MRIYASVALAGAILLAGPSVGRPGERGDPSTRLIINEHRLREQAKQEIIERRKKQIARLQAIIKDTSLHTRERDAVLAAIELLGELRAGEAASDLAGLLLFGKRGRISDAAPDRVLALRHPDEAAPAVRALGRIGLPALEPVKEVLLGLAGNARERDRLHLHCLWVVKDVLGPELGRAWLAGLGRSDRRVAEDRFVKDGLEFMEIWGKIEFGRSGRPAAKPVAPPRGRTPAARVQVLPALIRAPAGRPFRLTAKAYGRDGQETELTPVWSCTGGRITREGAFSPARRDGFCSVSVRDRYTGRGATALVQVVAAPAPPPPPPPAGKITVLKWDAGGGNFLRPKVKATVKVEGRTAAKITLLAVSPKGQAVAVKTKSCGDGDQVVFDEKYDRLSTGHLEFRLYDSRGRVLACVAKRPNK